MRLDPHRTSIAFLLLWRRRPMLVCKLLPPDGVTAYMWESRMQRVEDRTPWADAGATWKTAFGLLLFLHRLDQLLDLLTAPAW